MRVYGKLRESIPEAAGLSLVELFAFPTVATLAARLAQTSAEAEAAVAHDRSTQLASGANRMREQRARRGGA